MKVMRFVHITISASWAHNYRIEWHYIDSILSGIREFLSIFSKISNRWCSIVTFTSVFLYLADKKIVNYSTYLAQRDTVFNVTFRYHRID